MSVEVAYVGNHGARVFVGDGPSINGNDPTLVGFGTLSQDQRKPYFARYGWTQGIDVFCNCGTNRYDSLQTKLTKRFANGYSFFASYTLQRQRQHDGGQFFYLPDLEYGPAGWARKHSLTLILRCTSCHSRDENRWLGGWQLNQSHDHPERAPRSMSATATLGPTAIPDRIVQT